MVIATYVCIIHTCIYIHRPHRDGYIHVHVYINSYKIVFVEPKTVKQDALALCSLKICVSNLIIVRAIYYIIIMYLSLLCIWKAIIIILIIMSIRTGNLL